MPSSTRTEAWQITGLKVAFAAYSYDQPDLLKSAGWHASAFQWAEDLLHHGYLQLPQSDQALIDHTVREIQAAGGPVAIFLAAVLTQATVEEDDSDCDPITLHIHGDTLNSYTISLAAYDALEDWYQHMLRHCDVQAL